ncbi:Astacin-like metalloprotease toxin 1 [Araneus ventricosus]|uniref:Metalloendopeptidase n=1 Tax=Araneus ventricosus TaxID=182803 RepID=A0A4Y2CMF6_ARAVE|nr:Astacin-like metalloprotease toxin 1 [Araneus ventricosus]
MLDRFLKFDLIQKSPSVSALRLIMFILIVLGLAASTCAERLRNPLENPGLYQGDILGIDDDDDRNALVTNNNKWPRAVIPYVIDPGLEQFSNQIEKAMKYISDRTCITFEPRRYAPDYIRIFPGDGCYSHWGRTGGAQPVSLGDGCLDLGTIMHELFHAVGFMHEQVRSDRDDYLTIYWDNIQPGFEHNFQKLKPNENWLINEFDYYSIMIYSETSFSIDGVRKTMVPKKPGVVLTDVFYRYPTESDMHRTNVLYQCNMYL